MMRGTLLVLLLALLLAAGIVSLAFQRDIRSINAHHATVRQRVAEFLDIIGVHGP